MHRIIIIGAGGLAAEVFELLTLVRPTADTVILSDPAIPEDEPDLLKGLWRGGVALLDDELDGFDFVVAVGDPAARRDLSQLARSRGGQHATLIHPTASVGASCRLGEGAIVLSNVSVTAVASVGCGAVLNPGVRISHHCSVGDFATFGPNAVLCGRSRVGDAVLIGAGAVVNPGVSVASEATVGAGAVVHTDILEAGMWAGVPARPLRHRPSRS